MSRLRTMGIVLSIIGLAGLEAAAQGLDTERFKPALDSQGMVLTEGGQGELAGDLNLGLYLHYSHDPLVVSSRDGELERSLVEHRVGMSFLVSLGMTDWLSVGVEVPATVYQQGQRLDDAGVDLGLADAALGDVRVSPKLTILREDKFGVALALAVPVTLPSGDETAYLGSDSVTAAPTLALSGTLFDRLTLALNLGTWLTAGSTYRDVAADHEFFYRAGALFRFDDAWAVSGEGQGSARLESMGENKPNETSLEWLVAVHYKTPWDVRLVLGGAMGSLPGWGTPDGRAFLGLFWEPRTRDADDDGIEDDEDRCPQEAGPADNDGCPWKDSDGDGLTDDKDKCKDQAGPVENQGCPWGDKDQDGVTDNLDRCPDEAGPADNQGCPWGDKDQDGLTDNLDRCPDEAGPADNQGCPWGDKDQDGVTDNLDRCPDEAGPADNQGCPHKDSDGDGLLDHVDRCPDSPEDKDGFEDEDGCPDLDNDRDGIPDAQDKCPDEPETINGFKDEDGCPDKGKVLVIVRAEKIEILDKIYFNTARATIQPRSFKLLDQIAQTLRGHVEIKKLRIEGHTDAQGPDEANMRLSQKRAEAVRDYLVKKGQVDAARLEAVGFGETRAIAPNNTARGREQNRRVEFVIVQDP